MRSAIVVDLAPARGRHGERGIGRYVRGIASAVSALPIDLTDRVCVVGDRRSTPKPLGGCVIDPREGAIGSHVPELFGRAIAMARAVRDTGALAVHATDPQLPWTPSAPRTLVTVYDLIPMREPEMLRSWRADHRFRYRRYLHQIQRADRVVAISRSTAADVHERLGVPLETIHVVYPLVAGRPVGGDQRTPSDPPTFLAVGALDRHKQPELALRAFAIVGPRLGARLRFVGPGATDERERLRALAATLGVVDSVSFDGRIPDEGLERAYRSAAALLSTSRIEGFGLPPVEAAIRGTPVIAVDTPTARETVSGVATLVADDAEAVAAAMLSPRLPSLEARRALAARFGLEAVARSLEAVYRPMTE